MYNEVISSKLLTCLEHIEAVEEYVKDIRTVEEFAKKYKGLTYYGSIMRLQALGENLKRIAIKHPFVIEDLNYPEIDNVIRFRDYVSHHYEQLEHETVFEICTIKITELKKCISSLIDSKK